MWGILMWLYLQSYTSLPTKPAWPQHQQVLTKGPPPRWERNPLILSLLIFLSFSCFAQALGNSTILKKKKKSSQMCASRTCSFTILMCPESHANTIWICDVLVRETVSVKTADIQICKNRWTMLGVKSITVLLILMNSIIAIQLFRDKTIQSQMCSEKLDITGQTRDCASGSNASQGHYFFIGIMSLILNDYRF